MRHTSSIHSRESIISPVADATRRFLVLSSFDISSMSVAYSTTESTPPCRILSFIGISFVRPYLVWILAVRLLLSFFMIFRFFPPIPFLLRTYRIGSSHALSYSFCTSRNITYAVCFLSINSFIVCFRTIRWSAVALPGIPPAWASVIFTCPFILSLIILLYNFPKLLARVIPLSFEHLPFFLCLCKFWLFRLVASRQGFVPLCVSCLWFLVGIFLRVCCFLWIFHLGFHLVQGFFSFFRLVTFDLA